MSENNPFLKVGDPIYKISTGQRVGVVRRAIVKDNWIDYEFSDLIGSIDNTSREWGHSFGTIDDAIAYKERELEYLRWVKNESSSS